jgi:ubiquinone/menaquinone biosynthesis C-methylase UbiE
MSTAEHYTHGHHESVMRSHTWRTAENSAAYLVPHLAAGLELLDLGSGPGTLTVDLARLVAPGRVVGVDRSEEVVARANGLAADHDLPHLSFEAGDAYHLRFEDATFDVVHAHQVLHHVADPVAVLREALRVLKPGGLLAVREVDYGGTIWAPASPGLSQWLTLYQSINRENGGHADAGRHLKRWVRLAGFERLESSASLWCFASDAEREWWGGSWADRVLQSEFAPLAIESGMAELSDLESIAKAWREWAASSDGWFAIPHGEILARRPE